MLTCAASFESGWPTAVAVQGPRVGQPYDLGSHSETLFKLETREETIATVPAGRASQMPGVWGVQTSCLESFEKMPMPSPLQFRISRLAGVWGAHYMFHRFPKLASSHQ